MSVRCSSSGMFYAGCLVLGERFPVSHGEVPALALAAVLCGRQFKSRRVGRRQVRKGRAK